MSTAEQHLEILAKHLDFEHSRILDIGSGGGELSLALSHEGAKVTGIECSRDQMKRAIARQGKDLYSKRFAQSAGPGCRSCKIMYCASHVLTKNV